MRYNTNRWKLVGYTILLWLYSCTHDPFVPDPNNPTGAKLCFETTVLPLFTSNCALAGCHSATSANDGYVLDSYANIIKKGIKPGSAAQSKIYEMLFKSGSDRMPPAPHPGLTAAQKSTIGQWINEGALHTQNCAANTCDTSAVSYSKSVAPILLANCVGCHNSVLAGAGYNLSGYAGVKEVVNFGRLLGTINYQPGFVGMPQGGRLTPCEIAIITKWVKAGAPNN
jgi:hypothetical protein